MFKRFFTWLKLVTKRKCDGCGVKGVQLYSDGWGMIFCKECDKEDAEMFGHMRPVDEKSK